MHFIDTYRYNLNLRRPVLRVCLYIPFEESHLGSKALAYWSGYLEQCDSRDNSTAKLSDKGMIDREESLGCPKIVSEATGGICRDMHGREQSEQRLCYGCLKIWRFNVEGSPTASPNFGRLIIGWIQKRCKTVTIYAPEVSSATTLPTWDD